MDYAAWRNYFERVTEGRDAEIPLAEAALVIASDEYPELDVAAALAQLDAMAEELRPRLPLSRRGMETIAALNAYLFGELGFHGNLEHYYDPHNSYLNDVLSRRTGIPILLAVMVLDLAQRLGLPIFGLGVPGHFCLKWQDIAEEIVFDPFNGGEILDPAAIEARVRETFHSHAEFQGEWLEPVGPKYILFRILSNLKGIFLQTRQPERAWQVVDKLLLLNPRATDELRDFGLLSLQIGAYRQAAIALEQYLMAHPDAPDAPQTRIYLRRALKAIERLN